MPFYYQDQYLDIKKYDMKLLPSSTSKREMYFEYIKTNAAKTDRLPSVSAFNRIWQKYLPHIIITWISKRNSTSIVRSANNLEKQLEVISYKRYKYTCFTANLLSIMSNKRPHYLSQTGKRLLPCHLKDTLTELTDLFTIDGT